MQILKVRVGAGGEGDGLKLLSFKGRFEEMEHLFRAQKTVPYGIPGNVDLIAGQVTFKVHFSKGQGSRQVILQLDHLLRQASNCPRQANWESFMRC